MKPSVAKSCKAIFDKHLRMLASTLRLPADYQKLQDQVLGLQMFAMLPRIRGQSRDEQRLQKLGACLMSSAITAVQEKGLSDYAQNGLTRFVLEGGRGGGVLQPGGVQSDQEQAIRKLLRKFCALTAMPLQRALVYSSRSQGAVERWHRTL